MKTWIEVDLSTKGAAFQQDEETQTLNRLWAGDLGRDDPRLKEVAAYFRHRAMQLQE